MATQPQPRTPNLALRRARQSMMMSQSQFAEAVRLAGLAMGAPNSCTKRLVQKWETGEHKGARLDYVRTLQAVTGLSPRELGFRMTPDDVDQADSSNVGTAGLSNGVASGNIAALISSMDVTADLVLEASMNRLHEAVSHPTGVEMRTAVLAHTAISRLFSLEHHSPARLLAPTVERRLATVTALLTAARNEQVRLRLKVSAGHGALLAGWLAFDRGENASALRLWEDASSVAEDANDDSLFAGCLIYQSYAAARRRDFDSAWQFAHYAREHSPLDLRARAWATARLALYAAERNDFPAAESAMHDALRIGHSLPALKPEDECLPWLRFFDRAMLLATTAHTAALIGDPLAPEYAAQAVGALSNAKVKARAIVLAEAAFAAAYVGEFKLCLDHGSAAVQLTHDLGVSVAADLLHEVVTLLLPEQHDRAVRELLPQLRTLRQTAEAEDGPQQEEIRKQASGTK